jgi:hypothetical protein
MNGEIVLKRRVIESWLLLLYIDCLMYLFGFRHVHATVHRPRHLPASDEQGTCADLSHAVDLACIFYFKRVQCLQRSAAAALLLQRHGWKAEMVIGAQLVPFQSHAWVEVDGVVVNDKPYIAEMFAVLERC